MNITIFSCSFSYKYLHKFTGEYDNERIVKIDQHLAVEIFFFQTQCIYIYVCVCELKANLSGC